MMDDLMMVEVGQLITDIGLIGVLMVILARLGRMYDKLIDVLISLVDTQVLYPVKDDTDTKQ